MTRSRSPHSSAIPSLCCPKRGEEMISISTVGPRLSGHQLSGYLYYPAVILQCILCISHSFPHKILLKTKTRLMNFCSENEVSIIHWVSKETSSEWHSLKSTASEWIIFGHILATVLLTKHISKTKWLIESKRSKMHWNRKRSLFKNHRNCSPLGHGVRHGQKQVRQ